MTRDEADRLKAGELPDDPEADTKTASAKVPRVLSVQDILNASAVRSLAAKLKGSTCTTSHYKLDKITGGLRKGFMWLLGADTSWGKSSAVIAIADDNIRLGKRVLIVSSEDTEEVYGDRLMARRAKISATRQRDQELYQDERERVKAVAAAAEDVPVYIDARRWPIEDLAPHVARVISEERVDIVVFDYIQEFYTKRRHQDERLKYKWIASQCRHVAKDAKIAGIICSQLTIDDKTKVPNRHHIRECRDIANASEVILIGFEPEADIIDKKTNTKLVPGGTKCIFVDKVKNGPRGAKIPMEWNTLSASFDTVQDPELERHERMMEQGGLSEEDMADYVDRIAP